MSLNKNENVVIIDPSINNKNEPKVPEELKDETISYQKPPSSIFRVFTRIFSFFGRADTAKKLAPTEKRGVLSKTVRGTIRTLDVITAASAWFNIFGKLVLRPIYSLVGKFGAFYEMAQHIFRREKEEFNKLNVDLKNNVLPFRSQNHANDDSESIIQSKRDHSARRYNQKQVLLCLVSAEMFILLYAFWAFYAIQQSNPTITLLIVLGLIVIGLPIIIALQILMVFKKK
ncbi:hypothetical protein N9M08_05980 [Porticoccaceae bacterium]|nr:hypothetical protein [Porticoccaceae bacterium]MDB2343082.1 hypothetical protein [Porticoccaceae bacterium]MDB2664403.1 hypothetical protein [Porticoccaceae bacterium]